MAEAPTVAVRGEAVREVAPEVARISLTVFARESGRQRAVSRLSERAGAVRGILDGYRDAIERQETGHIHVTPERKGRGERVSAHHGAVTTIVVVTDFTVLGDLMMGLADADHTTVAGPWWELRPDSPVYREVRRAAVADAVARATDYAGAVGARLASIQGIADVNLAPPPVPMPPAPGGPFAGAPDAGPPPLEVDPRQQTVSGQVEVRFTMTEPDPAALAG